MKTQPDFFMILESLARCATALPTNSVDSPLDSISLVKSSTFSLSENIVKTPLPAAKLLLG